MKVTREEVERIAKLAALAVDEQSLPALTAQIGRILEYVSQLEAVEDTTPDSAGTYPGPRQPWRDDTPSRMRLEASLQDLAPDFRDGLFLLPRLGGVGADTSLPPEDDAG